MINCKLTLVQQQSAFNTHQWIIHISRAGIFMAVYVSLISKYKFSQVKQFLVKQNAKLSPTSDHISQGSSQHSKFFGCQDVEDGETPMITSPLPGDRKVLGHLLQVFSPLSRAPPSEALQVSLACLLTATCLSLPSPLLHPKCH